MNSVRPTSVCDTTPLQRLESQSSYNSEPSSPIINGICIGTATGGGSGARGPAFAGSGTGTGGGGSCLGVDNPAIPISQTTATLQTTATQTTRKLSLANHNNNKIEINLNGFVNATNSVNKQKMDSHGTREICGRVLFDFIILCCVGLPILGFHLWGTSYRRGFFCDDESLKHPYRSSTIKSWMLYLMGLVLPIAMITAVEFFKSNSNKVHGFGHLSSGRFYFHHLELPDWIVECYKKIGVLVFGTGIGQLTTDIAKYSIGRLRPHFFDVCQPIMMDGSTCADPINAGRYIEEFTCLGNNVTARMLKEVRLSFPSGHSTFSFFTMLYMAIYLQNRMTWQRAKMFKHLLQFLFLMFAWYTALTRVSDYKHHWTDVMAGSAIGTFYALVVTKAMW